jgi:hypothetical protein
MEQANKDVSLLKKEMSLLNTKPPQEIIDEASQYLVGDPMYDEGMDLLIAYTKYEQSLEARSFIINCAKDHVLNHWKIICTLLGSTNISRVKDFSEKKKLASFVLPVLYTQLCSLLPNHKTYISSTTKIEVFKKDTFIAQLSNIVLSFVWMNDYVHDRDVTFFCSSRIMQYGYVYFKDIIQFFRSYLPYYQKKDLLQSYVSPLEYILPCWHSEDIVWPFFSKTGLIGTNAMLFCMRLETIGIGCAYDIEYRELVHAGRLKNLLDLSIHDTAHAHFYPQNIKHYNLSYEKLLTLLIIQYQNSVDSKYLEYMRLIFYIVHEMTDINTSSFVKSSKELMYQGVLQSEYYDNDKDSDKIRSLTINTIDFFNVLKKFNALKSENFMKNEGLYITEDSLLQSDTGVISKDQLFNFCEYIHQSYCDIWNRFKEEYKEEAKQVFPFED